ncbi:hypothetical protein AVEN_180923-1 [Araneus ventricosus]|uniref:Uncharacterized protein n=1 Tax=Araneus ventricosus TaxID=182803 RepID=A0A4Y2VB01_ARAVE|nr:hypothetical protein AVEN_180923-1 [Araneus ventricosus]
MSESVEAGCGTTPPEERLAPTYDLTCNNPIYTAYLQGNWVSNLQPSGTETETRPQLPLEYTKSSLLVSEERAFRNNYGTFKLGILH